MTASKSDIGSDLAKVDAYQLTDADYDEIPEASDADFARATVNKGGVPVRGRPRLGDKAKKQVTLRLDPEILAHFRASGDGWQKRINDVLMIWTTFGNRMAEGIEPGTLLIWDAQVTVIENGFKVEWDRQSKERAREPLVG